MRILFATTRGAGHVGPLVPFAHACVAAGHEVLVATAPSAAVHVKRAGLPFAALDEPDEAIMDEVWERVRAAPSTVDQNAIVFEEVFAGEFARSALPKLLQLADHWLPDVIVRETCEFASILAAEAIGVPDVHVGCFLAARDVPLRTPLARLRREFGLAVPLRRRTHAPYLTLAPRALEDPSVPEFPGTRRFRAPVARPRALPDWWDGSSAPLVYVSFGSAAAGNGYFPDVYRGAIDALADQPVRVLLTVGMEVDPAGLGDVPGNVHVEPWVPQSAVMGHAAAMVGHGGSGSTLAAMAAGLPLAVVPLFADQPENAQRVADVGAGLRLDGVSELAEAVRALLDDPSYGENARAVAGEIAALESVTHAVGLFADIAEAGLPLAA
ncbi:glycosyltransferase [Solirubrobacter soli]|uniref:glycosyltransferase n=1 Tax=Solirubrobacter soli TaxID=363832 RepID=UPI000409A1F8|nr:glycosyltransferase [Solirubrobacter soli]